MIYNKSDQETTFTTHTVISDIWITQANLVNRHFAIFR